MTEILERIVDTIEELNGITKKLLEKIKEIDKRVEKLESELFGDKYTLEELEK